MQGETKKIAICCTTIHKEPMAPIIDSLAENMHGRNYKLVVFQCFEDLYYMDPNDLGERTIFDVINVKMFDMVIVFPAQMYDKERFKQICLDCEKNGVPVLSVDECLDHSFHVRFGYGEAFGSIVEHVLTVHGCRKIKFFAGMRNNDFSQTRIDSCREVMARHGLELPDSDIMYGNFWDGPTYEEMDKFFASGEPLPDAFICSNDSMAMAVCKKLNDRGYKIPDDVIVTGFDGIEMEKYHRPRLCTATRDNNEIAQVILELADRIVGGEKIESFDKEILYKPVFSESCGCTKIDISEGNKRLIDYVSSHAGFRNFEEHIDKMENRIAANSAFENVRYNVRKFGFERSVVCITKNFYSFFGETSKSEESAVSSTYPQDMVIFTNTTDETNAENTVFNSSELLPNIDAAAGEQNNIVYVLPVHFQENNLGYMLTPYSPSGHHNELLSAFMISLNRSLETMRVRQHMEILNKRLSFLFNHDHLTGIYNRYGFYDSFRKKNEECEGEKDVFIVSADLNDMKYINDNFGHAAGDDALVISAQTLIGAAQGDKDIICSRFGGDEFVVAKICGGDAKEQSEAYHERLISELERLNAQSGYPFKVQISFGVFSANLDGIDNLDGLIELADRLMYTDKAKYKRKPRNLPPND